MTRLARLAACISVLLCSCVAAAESIDDVPLFGHNMTATADTPKAGRVIAGNYILGYSPNDRLMIGTSPWLLVNYNMGTYGIKYAFPGGGIFDRISIESVFFKTYHVFFDWYHQQSLMERLSATKRLASWYRIHASFVYQYFWDDLAPYSLRPPPLNGTPSQLSLGLLQEIHFSQPLGIFFESGFLSMNYPNNYLQFGLSGFYKRSWGFIQLGLSKSYPVNGNQLPYAPQHVWIDRGGIPRSSIYYTQPSPIHPEIQVEILL